MARQSTATVVATETEQRPTLLLISGRKQQNKQTKLSKSIKHNKQFY